MRLDQKESRARAGAQVRAERHHIPGGVHGYDGTQFFTRPVVGRETPFDRLLRFPALELRSAGDRGENRADR